MELFEFAPDAYIETDHKGVIQEANHAAGNLLRVRTNFLVGKPLRLFVEPADASIFYNLLEENQHTRISEIHIVLRDHTKLVVAVTVAPFFDPLGNKGGYRWMLRDITSLKQAENELMEVKRQLLSNNETERLLLARELHDGPIQDLYGAVFKLTSSQAVSKNRKVQQNLDETQAILKQVAGTLRAICGELRPPTLANLGIERAIRSHVEEIRDRHPEMQFTLNLQPEERPLPQEIRLAVFRIYQQCISNVLLHSNAQQVKVALEFTGRTLRLSVSDDGMGFRPPDKWVDLLREGHYGLAGIAERVDALGGKLKIDTKPGAGTLVHVAAPRSRKA